MSYKSPRLAGKVIPAGTADGCKVALSFTVEGGLHYIKGNRTPYFSLTYTSHQVGRPNQYESGGAGHDTILRHYPQFADLAALHLSDIDGVPMHAEANGWYDLAGSLGGYGERYHVGNSERHFPCQPPEGKPWQTTVYRKPTTDECLAIFADHCRISIDEATAIRNAVHMAGWAHMKTWGLDIATRAAARAKWGELMEAMRPRWKAEAEACIKRHGLVVYGDPWPDPQPDKS